jgi:tyrosyl-tRNA synthetase
MRLADHSVSKREDLDHLLTERRVGAYVGVDPTAPSLHIGHLVPFMALGWFFIHGYSSVFLVIVLPLSSAFIC